MPWTVEDVESHMKGLSASRKKTWVEVANKALEACAGEDDCEASAIKQANVVVGRLGESVSLAEAMRKALDEHDEQVKEEDHEEAVERSDMDFVEIGAGQLTPWEGECNPSTRTGLRGCG